MAVDTTYGSGGRLDLPLGAADTAVDASGKLLAAGYFGAPESRSGALWRFNPDGSPDPTFNRGGLATLAGVGPGSGLEWNAVLPLPDSRVVVAGIRRQQLNDGTQRERPVLARYNADGTLDKSFGGEGDDDGVLLPAGGTSDGMIADLARLADGRILAGGNVVDQPPDDFYDVALWRFNADGTPDATFGAGGFRQQDVEAEDYLRAVAAAPDGSFFINDQHGVFAFKADGTLRGRVSDPAAFHGVVAPTPDGKFVVATVVLGGTDSNPRFTTTVRRYLADGTPDPGFGSGPGGGTALAIGERGDVAAAVAVLPGGGTLVAAGSLEENYAQHSTLVRLAPDGALDSAFGVNGVFTEPFLGGAGPLLPLAGGRLLVVGTTVDRSDPSASPRQTVIAHQLDPGIVVDPGGPYGPVGEGGQFEVSGAGSTAAQGRIVKYEWDADFGGFEFTPDAEGQTATLSAGDDKPLTRVALRVTTDDGLQAVSPVPAEVDVRNVPPTVTGMGHNPPFEAFGVGYLLIYGKVSDPGGDEVTVRVDFGDGTAPADAHVEFGTFVVEHTYGARGTYTVTATATDDQGASSTGEMTVTTMDLVGRVFQDGNDNGRGSTEGDPGVPGVTVYLDSDGDGTLDEGEPRTVSDDAGYYTFPVLDNGTYSVRIVTPPGQRVTNAPADLAPVTLAGASGVRRDFGLSDRARITGVVFRDANGDGVRDPGETPVQSLVTLRNLYIDLDKDGWYDPTEPTSEAIGDEYAFLNLRPGTYTVRYLPGLTRSDAPDSRAAQTYPYERGGQTGYTVTVGTAEVSSGHDFGSYFGNTAVAGAVYLDRNRDGDRDASSTGEVGLAGRVAYLDSDGDGALDPDESRSGTVNPGSTYFLPVVPGRTYTVRTVLPDGWTQSQPNGGAPYVITVNPQDTASLQNRNFGTHVIGSPAVVGRHLFYFRSAFGGGSATDPRDDGAIATDKAALLPGERASFANVGSYSRGINGVMVDLNDFIHAAPNGNYLHFAVGDGTSQEPTAWKTVFGSVQVRRGAGVGGSDRLVVTFADNAIRNQWLRVTVDPGVVTGLAAPDVFYFGNLVGDTGDALSPFRVTAADLGAIRKALNMNAGVSNRYDVNRDGKVDALDLGLAKANLNRSLPALAIPVPVPVGGAPAPAPASDRDGFLAGLLA